LQQQLLKEQQRQQAELQQHSSSSNLQHKALPATQAARAAAVRQRSAPQFPFKLPSEIRGPRKNT